ncbi:hypothetical protein RCL1_006144 [Eukaryota sp. TZLM3-RCL]
MVRAGVSADMTLSCLKLTDPNCLLTEDDLYNFKTSMLINDCSLKPSIDNLIVSLHEKDFFIYTLWSSDGRISHFFLIYKASINLLKNYGFVLQMDATYNTTNTDMRLFSIIGTTPIETSYPIAFCYIPRETTLDFMWVLQKFRAVSFPSATFH